MYQEAGKELANPSTSRQQWISFCQYVGTSWRWLLTPLGELQSQFLIDPAEDENHDEVEHRGGDAGDCSRIGLQEAGHATVQRDGDENPVQYDHYDEYQHDAGLQTNGRMHIQDDLFISWK